MDGRVNVSVCLCVCVVVMVVGFIIDAAAPLPPTPNYPRKSAHIIM